MIIMNLGKEKLFFKSNYNGISNYTVTHYRVKK